MKRVAVIGDPGVEASLTEAGVCVETSDVSTSGSDLDAALIRLTPTKAIRTAWRPSLGDGRHVLIAGGGTPKVRDGVPRPRRAAELAGALLAGAAYRLLLKLIASRLRRQGRQVEILEIGDRSRNSYRIGTSQVPGPRPPAGLIVVTARHQLEANAVHFTLERVGNDLGINLVPKRITVVETGKLLIVAEGSDNRSYMVRLAAGLGRELLANGLFALERITGASVDPLVRGRAVAPQSRGEIGTLLFSAEPLMPGAPPREMNPMLWHQCIDFLARLRRIDPILAIGKPQLADAAAEIANFVEQDEDRQWLTDLGRRLDSHLAELPRGWEHGDFWLENLLVESGSLASVLDWDTARPDALPLLDMFDLISLSIPGQTALTPGERLTASIWPAVAETADPRLLEYCRAIDLEPDPATLRDLARAYWLTRVARDLREVPDRRFRPGWLAANIAHPIRFLRSTQDPGFGSASANLG